MNKIFILFVVCITGILSSCSSPTYYFDENRNEIDKKTFYSEWRNKNKTYTRWSYKSKDSGTVNLLKRDLHKLYTVNHDYLKKYLESITNKKYTDTTIFLIEFNYKEDLCTYGPPEFVDKNNVSYWSEERINERKDWIRLLGGKTK